MLGRFRKPKISIVMVIYDMEREAYRTLQSLSSPYQREINPKDYEVIVVDNGSPTPFGENKVKSVQKNFQYIYIKNAPSSPAHAVNLGINMARGDIVGILIDGARLVTPGLLHYARLAFKLYRDPTVVTPSWHLGPDLQQKSIMEGYDKEKEDKLLKKIEWPRDGYRLFEIASLAGSSERGCFLPLAESNAIFLLRRTLRDLGGFDTRFNIPGGGFVNLDFYKRAVERSDAPLVVLLGEGSFHQLHGGISTNVCIQESSKRFHMWEAQYREIRGKSWSFPEKAAYYLGYIPPQAFKYIAWSAEQASRLYQAYPPLCQDRNPLDGTRD